MVWKIADQTVQGSDHYRTVNVYLQIGHLLKSKNICRKVTRYFGKIGLAIAYWWQVGKRELPSGIRFDGGETNLIC